MAVGLKILVFVLIGQFDVCAPLHQLNLDQFAIDHLFHHETQTNVLRIVVSDIHQTSVYFRVDFLEEIYGGNKVGNCNEHAQV